MAEKRVIPMLKTNLKSASTHCVHNRTSIREVLDVPDLQHGAIIRERLVRAVAVRAHPKLSGACLHRSPGRPEWDDWKYGSVQTMYALHESLWLFQFQNIVESPPDHQTISRLKNMQWTGDVGEAHGANKHGYCDLQRKKLRNGMKTLKVQKLTRPVPSSMALPPAMSIISSSNIFFRSANSFGSRRRMLLSRNSLTHIFVELCAWRLALHRGHSRLWSRLRSMHALNIGFEGGRINQ